jgi:hypothetical protein
VAQSPPRGIIHRTDDASIFTEGIGGKIYAENWRGRRISGAYGDVGTDDSKVVHLAAASLASGGNVKIENGIYYLTPYADATTAISTPLDYIRFQGKDNTRFQLQSDIVGIKFIGKHSGAFYGPAGALMQCSVNDIKFSPLTLGQGTAIQTTESVQDLCLSHNSFENLLKAIEFTSPGAGWGTHHNTVVERNWFIGNNISIHCNGATMHDCRVIGNKEVGWEARGTPAAPVFFLKVDGSSQMFEWLLHGNSIEHIFDQTGASYVFYVAGTTVVADNVFSDNMVEECNGVAWVRGAFVVSGYGQSNVIFTGGSWRVNQVGLIVTGPRCIAKIDGVSLIHNSYANNPTAFYAYNLDAGKVICQNNFINSVYRPGSIFVSAGTTPAGIFQASGNYSEVGRWIFPGEICTIRGSISTLTENAFNSLDNPFGQNVALLALDIYVSTGATATSPNIDCGIGSSATADYTNLFDDLPGETIGLYNSKIATPGTQTQPILWQSGAGNRYLNMSIKDAAATGMVATYVATVMGL